MDTPRPSPRTNWTRRPPLRAGAWRGGAASPGGPGASGVRAAAAGLGSAEPQPFVRSFANWATALVPDELPPAARDRNLWDTPFEA